MAHANLLRTAKEYHILVNIGTHVAKLVKRILDAQLEVILGVK